MYLPYFIIAAVAFLLLSIISPIRLNDKSKSETSSLILSLNYFDFNALQLFLFALALPIVWFQTSQQAQALLLITYIIIANKNLGTDK